MSKTATPAAKTKPAPTIVLDTKDRPAPIRRPRGTAPTSRSLPEVSEVPVAGEPLDDQPNQRRQWLTEDEVERIVKHAANERDKLMILVAYRHGLRVSELIHFIWAQIDLDTGRLTVRRLKNGEDSVHPLSGREIRGLRKLRRSQPVGSRYVFITGRGAPITRNGFFKLLEKAAAKAGIAEVHPHLLRHGTGFKLVNDGLDTLSLAAYLGHANIQNTKRYAKMDARRFDGLWRD